MIVVLTALIVCATAVVLTVLRRPVPAPPVEPVAPHRSILDERLLESVVVNLKSGTTFTGVLYVEDQGAVVLCKAAQVQPDGSKVSADGEIVLLRADIDFIQRP